MSTTYASHVPTAFDRHIPLDDREDWYLAPVSRTRDSGVLDKSNFAVALDMLGGESDTCEVHRFGHWGPGWYEIILVSPERRAEVEEMAAQLENYHILSEDDYSAREDEAEQEAWDSYGRRDFAQTLADEFGFSAEVRSRLAAADWLWDVYRDVGGEFHDEEGSFYFYGVELLDRTQLSDYIKSARRTHVAST